MNNAWTTNLGPLIDHKLYELGKLGSAAKQLATRKMHKKLARRCHIAMAFIVNDIRPVYDEVLKARPDMKDLFEALALLYKDCENGYKEHYINDQPRKIAKN